MFKVELNMPVDLASENPSPDKLIIRKTINLPFIPYKELNLFDSEFTAFSYAKNHKIISINQLHYDIDKETFVCTCNDQKINYDKFLRLSPEKTSWRDIED